MKIKNWEKFQHYTPMNSRFQKKMTWFKMYGDDLLNDADFMKLSDECQSLLIKLWCLASRKNGELPNADGIAFALRKDKSFVIKNLSHLKEWIEDDDSNMLADCYQPASLEKEEEKEEEEDRDKNIEHFERFWNAYPRKVSKNSCMQKWRSRKLDKIADEIIKHVEFMKNSKQWKENKGEWIPMPLTYINQERWDEGVPTVKNIWDNAI